MMGLNGTKRRRTPSHWDVYEWNLGSRRIQRHVNNRCFRSVHERIQSANETIQSDSIAGTDRRVIFIFSKADQTTNVLIMDKNLFKKRVSVSSCVILIVSPLHVFFFQYDCIFPFLNGFVVDLLIRQRNHNWNSISTLFIFTRYRFPFPFRHATYINRVHGRSRPLPCWYWHSVFFWFAAIVRKNDYHFRCASAWRKGRRASFRRLEVLTARWLRNMKALMLLMLYDAMVRIETLTVFVRRQPSVWKFRPFKWRNIRREYDANYTYCEMTVAGAAGNLRIYETRW